MSGDPNGGTKSDQAAILIFATRYALGRMTYAPEIVRTELVRQADVLDGSDLDVLIRDIEDHRKQHGFGMDCDAATWERTLAWLRERREVLA